MSRYDRYDAAARKVLQGLQKLVRAAGRQECRLADLAQAFLLVGGHEIERLLEVNGLRRNPEVLNAQNVTAAASDAPHGKLQLSPELRSVLDRAEALAGSGLPVQRIHLLRAAWPEIAEPLLRFVQADGVRQPGDLRLPDELATPSVVQLLPVPPQLATAGRDLTAERRPYPIVGREREIDQLVAVLMKFYRPNALLVGDPGVGKTTVVEGLAERIRRGNVPERLQGCRVIELKLGARASSVSSYIQLGEWLKDLLDVAEANPHVILFLDDIQSLLDTRAPFRWTDLLKSILTSAKTRIIAACDFSAYQAMAQDPSLVRCFQTIRIEEPTPEATEQILRVVRPHLEEHYKISVPDPTLMLTVSLASEYMENRRFPEKAIDILDRACIHAARRTAPMVEPEDVRKTVAEITGIELVENMVEYGRRLASLEEVLGKEVFGQPEAVAAVANVVRLCKRKLDLRPERPDGVFLFTGPTGVGKTALALALAKALTGREDRCIRIDMSEFAEEHRISGLIGSPPGYVGYDDQPRLLLELRRCSGGVLLLDEFEKAHPAVHRLFLQVFDSGRLTSARGETFSLSHMTIICTSNIWEGGSVGRIGFSPDARSSRPAIPWDLLKRHLPAELLNRFDEIVVFQPISHAIAAEILEKRILAPTRERLMREYGVVLEITPEAVDAILRHGYSPEFGVRHLQRIFQDLALHKIVRALDSSPPGSRIVLNASGDEFNLIVETPACS